jgi:hypothetical protein
LAGIVTINPHTYSSPSQTTPIYLIMVKVKSIRENMDSNLDTQDLMVKFTST